jgi:hypothetical protein
MIERCWEDCNAYSLAFWGVCDCVSACELKAQIVDLLLDLFEPDGIEAADAACELAAMSVPRFRTR